MAAYLPSSISGGARRAEEVIVHTVVTAMKATAPAGATSGRAKKATQEMTVTAATIGPTRPSVRVTLSVTIPVRKSQTVNTAWSSIRSRMMAPAAIPAVAASCGR